MDETGDGPFEWAFSVVVGVRETTGTPGVVEVLVIDARGRRFV